MESAYRSGAEKGKANVALIRFLADALDVPRQALTIVVGHSGRDKVLEVAGLSQPELEARLADASEAA